MHAGEVAIRSFRLLRGPNLYAYMPVMVITLAIGSYDEEPSTNFPGFAERLSAWLPGLQEHRCSPGRPGGFIERLRRGTYLPHIAEHVALELQGIVGFPLKFGRTRGTGEPGVYRVVIAYKQPELARPSFETALELVLAAMHDTPFNVARRIRSLQEIADEYRLGPSTEAIAEAARARGIPVERLTPTDNLLQLGWGIYQRRIQAAETSLTSSIAEGICQDKSLTNQVLETVGLPVPEGYIVSSAREAWAAAQRCGLPVVVKPANGHQGEGVSTNLSTRASVLAAFAQARKHASKVLVERHIEGFDFRLLIVNGKMVAASRRDPPHIVGNGRQTVLKLVETVNRDPRRGEGHGSPLTRIPLDGVTKLVLSKQNMTWLSIPSDGQLIKLRDNCNLSTGGTAVDVTDDVHPDNSRLAELAAQVVGLDIAGVDIICKDIRRPLKEQGGAIIEVNASPGLRMHLYPAEGRPRPVGEAVIDSLYPAGSPSRVPLIAVTGTNGKTTVVRLITHMYKLAGKVVGMTSTEGTFVDGEQIIEGDCSGPRSARSVLSHPRVEVAVLETARGGMLREGLAFDNCTIAVVTNVAGDHLGLEGIDTLEELARVKQIIVDSVPREGASVLNADDPLVANMAGASAGRVVYFSLHEQNPIIASHLEAGGDSVLVRNGGIVLASGSSSLELVQLSRIGFTGGGNIAFQVQNTLASTAAAWAAGLNPSLIAQALVTFQNDPFTLPGRFNVIDIDGIQVILDYAHNTAALTALGQAVEVLGKRRTHMVIGLPGDRRDNDLVEAICATRSYVDGYIVRDDSDRRGRAKREIFRLARKSLTRGVPAMYVGSERDAIQKALNVVQPGERLIIIVDKIENALNVLDSLSATAAIGKTLTKVPEGSNRAA